MTTDTTASDQPDSGIDAEAIDTVPDDTVPDDTVSGDTESPLASPADATDTTQLLEREGDIAADYLEVLLDIADLDGDIDIDVDNDRAAVSIIGSGLGGLVGPGGSTLDALQELTRLAVHRETGVRTRLMLDVGGHRARRRAELTEQGAAAAHRVLESGESERLAAMTPFERKIVHDAVAAVDGVVTESEGEEPNRRVVIHRA